MTSPTTFFIMTPWGRVGSNLLLNSLGQVVGPMARKFANENFNRLRDGAEQLAWTRAFYGAPENPPLIGCKQNMLSIGDRDGLGALLAELAIPLIRLRRANLLKVAVSQLRAEIYAERSRALTGVAAWGVRSDDQPLEPVPLDPTRFLQVAGQARLADALLADFRPATPTLEVEYAQLRDGGGEVAERVCGWLGLAVIEPARPRFIKATPDDLAAAVPNLADLRQALRDSALRDLEPMFDAG